MLRTRTLSALVLLALVSVLLWLGGAPWLVAIILVALLATQEFFSALRQINRQPVIAAGFLTAVALPAAAYGDRTLALMLPIIVAAVMFSLLLVLLRQNPDGALADWALSLAGSLYIALLLSYFVALREYDQGLHWILLAFLCTWACDSFAYLIGRAIGRRRFAPRISPHKTWEGTIAGTIAATAVGLLAVPLLGLQPVTGLLLGAAVALLAITGDLAESLLKRQLDIKDFGTLIPGHGGILDRIDSLLFAVPFIYYVAVAWSTLH